MGRKSPGTEHSGGARRVKWPSLCLHETHTPAPSPAGRHGNLHTQPTKHTALFISLALSPHTPPFLSLPLSHPSTCGWRCRAPRPAASLCQNRPSLLPWCCTATNRLTRRDDGNRGDRTYEKQRRTLSPYPAQPIRTTEHHIRTYLTGRGVAGSTLGFCF